MYYVTCSVYCNKGCRIPNLSLRCGLVRWLCQASINDKTKFNPVVQLEPISKEEDRQNIII